MQTTDTHFAGNDLVSSLFEACGAFATSPEGTPVCAGCGWLEAEHAPEIAEVRSLPARQRAPASPRRLAS